MSDVVTEDLAEHLQGGIIDLKQSSIVLSIILVILKIKWYVKNYFILPNY